MEYICLTWLEGVFVLKLNVNESNIKNIFLAQFCRHLLHVQLILTAEAYSVQTDVN